LHNPFDTVLQVIMGSQLANDKQLATSLRWLAKDKKNGFRNLIIHILEVTGINDQGCQHHQGSLAL
jgi:hypothetical protein